MNNKGFTLVELMTVLGILSILAGISIGIGPGIIQKAKEKAEIREFISQCRKSQMHAIKSNLNVVIVFGPNSYYFFEDKNKNFILDPKEDQTTIKRFERLSITSITTAGGLAFNNMGMCIADNRKLETPMAEIILSNKYVIEIILTGVIKTLSI